MQNQNTALAYKSITWFNEHDDLVLEVGIRVDYLQTGTYKIGDGSTKLITLNWLGGGAPPIPVPIATGSMGNITAHVGGGQGSAFELTKEFNRCDSCANDLDSIKVGAATDNAKFQLLNASTQEKKINLYPATGEKFRVGNTLLAINDPITVSRRNTVRVYCFEGETGIFTVI